ncbi:response regulator [bacterium]|nr:response regulator [bacterium]
MPKVRLLIVDDEKDVRLLFEQRFRKEIRSGDVELVYAYSGEEALALLKAADMADIILILSDINMPGMTGLELLRHVKKDLPEKGVLMITAYGDEKTRQTAEQYGADDFVTKPIDFAHLKSRIATLVEEYKDKRQS